MNGSFRLNRLRKLIALSLVCNLINFNDAYSYENVIGLSSLDLLKISETSIEGPITTLKYEKGNIVYNTETPNYIDECIHSLFTHTLPGTFLADIFKQSNIVEPSHYCKEAQKDIEKIFEETENFSSHEPRLKNICQTVNTACGVNQLTQLIPIDAQKILRDKYKDAFYERVLANAIEKDMRHMVAYDALEKFAKEKYQIDLIDNKTKYCQAITGSNQSSNKCSHDKLKNVLKKTFQECPNNKNDCKKIGSLSYMPYNTFIKKHDEEQKRGNPNFAYVSHYSNQIIKKTKDESYQKEMFEKLRKSKSRDERVEIINSFKEHDPVLTALYINQITNDDLKDPNGQKVSQDRRYPTIKDSNAFNSLIDGTANLTDFNAFKTTFETFHKNEIKNLLEPKTVNNNKFCKKPPSFYESCSKLSSLIFDEQMNAIVEFPWLLSDLEKNFKKFNKDSVDQLVREGIRNEQDIQGSQDIRQNARLISMEYFCNTQNKDTIKSLELSKGLSSSNTYGRFGDSAISSTDHLISVNDMSSNYDIDTINAAGALTDPISGPIIANDSITDKLEINDSNVVDNFEYFNNLGVGNSDNFNSFTNLNNTNLSSSEIEANENAKNISQNSDYSELESKYNNLTAKLADMESKYSKEYNSSLSDKELDKAKKETTDPVMSKLIDEIKALRLQNDEIKKELAKKNSEDKAKEDKESKAIAKATTASPQKLDSPFSQHHESKSVANNSFPQSQSQARAPSSVATSTGSSVGGSYSQSRSSNIAPAILSSQESSNGLSASIQPVKVDSLNSDQARVYISNKLQEIQKARDIAKSASKMEIDGVLKDVISFDITDDDGMKKTVYIELVDGKVPLDSFGKPIYKEKVSKDDSVKINRAVASKDKKDEKKVTSAADMRKAQEEELKRKREAERKKLLEVTRGVIKK